MLRAGGEVFLLRGCSALAAEDCRTLYQEHELNLKLLDSLVKYFDRDYKYATSHIGQ